MKITCTVDTLREAIAEIERYEESLPAKTKKLMEKLAEIGIEEATVRFSNAFYDGTNDVSVDNTPTWEGENKLVVRAFGQSIAFIEFGTGIYNTEEHPKADDFGAVRGAYGQGKGMQRGWGYYGDPGEANAGGIAISTPRGTVIMTSGNNPNRAMYDAAQEMRARIVTIAKEVFNSD